MALQNSQLQSQIGYLSQQINQQASYSGFGIHVLPPVYGGLGVLPPSGQATYDPMTCGPPGTHDSRTFVPQSYQRHFPEAPGYAMMSMQDQSVPETYQLQFPDAPAKLARQRPSQTQGPDIPQQYQPPFPEAAI